MVGEIVHGEVYQIWKNEILIMDDEGNELVLPKMEQIKSDFFKKGDTVRAVIKEVELRNNLPRVKLSRTDPKFLEAMLELEVSEVMEGIIAIKKVVREPGEKAKIAVEDIKKHSGNDNVHFFIADLSAQKEVRKLAEK